MLGTFTVIVQSEGYPVEGNRFGESKKTFFFKIFILHLLLFICRLVRRGNGAHSHSSPTTPHPIRFIDRIEPKDPKCISSLMICEKPFHSHCSKIYNIKRDHGFGSWWTFKDNASWLEIENGSNDNSKNRSNS